MTIVTLTSCKKSPTASEPDTGMTDLTGRLLGQALPGKTPVIFAPGIISAGKSESYLVEAPGGDEIFYLEIVTKNNDGFATILQTKLVDGRWTKPATASFSGTYSDAPIAIHPDGSRFYFSSVRPIDRSESIYESNIWYVEKVGGTWGQPKSMGKPINGRNITSGPSVTSTGTMYFTEVGSGGRNEIFRSEFINGKYQEPEELPAQVNSSHQQYDSYIAPDESFLLYGAYLRPDTFGGSDLYVAFRDAAGNWSKSLNMGPLVNTAADEGTATITTDGKYIFYAKYNGSEKKVDIYWFSKAYIDELKANAGI